MKMYNNHLYRSVDHVWSILFTAGYLTKRGKAKEGVYQLVIPNQEIRKIFIEQIQDWFHDETRKDKMKLDAFCDAFVKADADTIEKQFNMYLKKTISIRDTAVQKEKKENLPTGKATTKSSERRNSSACFYHGILLGLLSHRGEWEISSNAESGIGYSDILVEAGGEKETGIVIEIKYSDNGDLEAGCEEALRQIEKKEYAAKLIEDGMDTVIKYGIACWKKKCKVRCAS